MMMSSTKFALLYAFMQCNIAQGHWVNVDTHDGKIKSIDMSDGNITAEEFLRHPRPILFGRSAVEDSNTCFTDTQNYYTLLGDGDPHQNYMIGQVKDTLISCPGTVTTGKSHTSSWSLSVGLNPGFEEKDFFSVGFSVTESNTQSTADGFTCLGSETEICAIHYTAVTAVSVSLFTIVTRCDGSHTVPHGAGTVYLPNANSIGSAMGRGVNFGDKNIIQCRGEDERNLLFPCGPKGTSDWFQTNEIGPWSKAYLAALDPPGCAVPIEAFKFLD